MVDINTTPLIDVMLVLLIMLIITIPIQTHAVKLDMPRDTPPPALVEPEVVEPRDRFRRHDHLERRDRTRPRRARTLSRAARPRRRRSRKSTSRRTSSSKYAAVAMVLAEAQRLGVVKIGIVGAEQFME